MTEAAFSRDQFQESIELLKKECQELSDQADSLLQQVQRFDTAAQAVSQLRSEVEQVHGMYLGLLQEDFLRRIKYYPNLAFALIKQEVQKLSGK